MAKLKSGAIKLEDMQEYLDSSSDFAFEMKVLKLLNDRGLETTFGGLYQDPNTNQTRQFDIRSKIILDSNKTKHSLLLAIECKNLRDNFPLLISGSKRKKHESVIDTWCFMEMTRTETNGNASSYKSLGYFVDSRTLHPSRFYMPECFVGRSCVQVGKGEKNNIEVSDSEIYNKWTQALCSLYGLMQNTVADMEMQVEQQGYASGSFAFVPIVIVPDDMIWIVEYSDSGELIVPPKQVAECSYWVSKQYSFVRAVKSCQYTVSHIEFMTFTGLKDFLDSPSRHWRILGTY